MSLLDDLALEYASALREYIETGKEEARFRAYETGRKAVAAHVGILEMSAVHQLALVQVLLEKLPEAEREKTARLASELAAESLVPLELTARGTRETATVLQQLNEALAGKNAELLQLHSLKDDLVSLIVHDLRNPLTGIRSCLGLIQPRDGDPDAESTREVVRLAREGVRKIEELANDLLEVRLLEEHKLPLRRERTDLVELAWNAMTTLEAAGRLDGVRLELVTEARPTLELDARLVRRSIENLVSNALKFSPPNSAVEIGVRETEDGFAIDVADRGPGIADDVRERLFQKFGSVGAKASGGRRGYGLGLYVVKLVAAAHGGSVTVGPRDGGGAVFRILLPR